MCIHIHICNTHVFRVWFISSVHQTPERNSLGPSEFQSALGPLKALAFGIGVDVVDPELRIPESKIQTLTFHMEALDLKLSKEVQPSYPYIYIYI